MPARDAPASPHQALQTAISARVADLLDAAQPWFETHNVCPPQPQLRFDLRGTAAGQARWTVGKRPVLRFNLDIATCWPDAFLAQTVPHEVAHLVTSACYGRARPHGSEWRAVMRFFGLPNPSRCHDYPVAASASRRQRRWPYVCGCQTHELSTTRHRRAQGGRVSYQCRRCGDRLTWVADPAA